MWLSNIYSYGKKLLSGLLKWELDIMQFPSEIVHNYGYIEPITPPTIKMHEMTEEMATVNPMISSKKRDIEDNIEKSILPLISNNSNQSKKEKLLKEEEIQYPYTQEKLKGLYPEQIKTGSDVVNKINEGKKNFMIRSPTQAGKSGVLIYIASKLLDKNRYYICAKRDNDLKYQVIRRFHEEFKLINVKILFLQEIMDYNSGKLLSNFDNSVIFHDESHFGTKDGQQIQKFLNRCVKVNMSSKSSEWSNKNCIMIGVSATSFTEDACNKQYELDREVIDLKPGKGYNGIPQLLAKGKILNSFKINKTSFNKLYNDVILKHQNQNLNSYMIIRLSKHDDLEFVTNYLRLINVCDQYDIIDEHSSCAKININGILDVAPVKPTLIFIYGSLTEGYTPNLRYVSFMFEGPACSSETQIQRLMGRACGYYDHDSPYIYTNAPVAQEYCKYLETGQYPSACKYLIKSKSQKCVYKLKSYVPIYKKLAQKLPNKMTKTNTKEILKGENDEQINNILNNYLLIGTSSTSINGKPNKTIKPDWDEAYKKYTRKQKHYINSSNVFNEKEDKQCYIIYNKEDNAILILYCDGGKKEITTTFTISKQSSYHWENGHNVITVKLKSSKEITNIKVNIDEKKAQFNIAMKDEDKETLIEVPIERDNKKDQKILIKLKDSTNKIPIKLKNSIDKIPIKLKNNTELKVHKIPIKLKMPKMVIKLKPPQISIE